jgi:hypothetical protein
MEEVGRSVQLAGTGLGQHRHVCAFVNNLTSSTACSARSSKAASRWTRSRSDGPLQTVSRSMIRAGNRWFSRETCRTGVDRAGVQVGHGVHRRPTTPNRFSGQGAAVRCRYAE